MTKNNDCRLDFERPIYRWKHLGRLCAASLWVLLMIAPASASEQITVKVATIPIDAGAEVFYALNQGFFTKGGLNVSIDPISNGPAIAAAVASGAIDIGFSNLVSLAEAFKRGVPITLIAPAGSYSAKAPTTVCMVARGSPIKSAKDLNGKIFATNGLRNIGEFGPRAWIDANGGDSSTVKFVEMPFPDMPGALAQHRIDAAVVSEPTASDNSQDMQLLSDCYDGIGKSFIIAAYFTTTAWALAHPALVTQFQEVMRTTAAWANRNQSASALILANVAKIDPAVATKIKNRVIYPERLEPTLIQPLIDVAAKYGALHAAFPASQMIYQKRSR